MITAFETTVLAIIEQSDRITIAAIAERLNVKRRSIERTIESLRNDSYPICSDCSTKPYGLYIAKSEAESQQWVRQMYSRINKMFKKCKLAKQHWSDKNLDAVPVSLFAANGPNQEGAAPETAGR